MMTSAFNNPTPAPVYQMPEDKRLAETQFLHGPQAAVWVPFETAAVTGVIVGLIFFLVCAKLRFWDGWFWSLLIAMLVTLAAWLVLKMHWFELTTVQKLESLLGRDLDGDHQVGVTDAKRHSVTVDVSTPEKNAYNSKTVNFPCDLEQIQTLANGLLAGRALTEKEWGGKGKIFSQPEFKAVRTVMLQKGLIYLVNPKAPLQGFKLTKAGTSTMKYFAALDTSPTPPDSIP